MAGLSMGGFMTASVTMVNLDKFSYIGLLSGGTAAGFGAGGPGSPIPMAAPPPPPASLDLKTIYSGAMADPAEFNKKVRVFFFSCGTEPPLENPEALKIHQKQLDCCRNHQQLPLYLSRHLARMADLEKEPVLLQSTPVQVGLCDPAPSAPCGGGLSFKGAPLHENLPEGFPRNHSMPAEVFLGA